MSGLFANVVLQASFLALHENEIIKETMNERIFIIGLRNENYLYNILCS